MIDLKKLEVGKTYPIIYQVIDLCGKIDFIKYTDCVLTEFEKGKHDIFYNLVGYVEKIEKTITCWYGSTPYWGSKIEDIFFSFDDAKAFFEEKSLKKIRELRKEREELTLKLRNINP